MRTQTTRTVTRRTDKFGNVTETVEESTNHGGDDSNDFEDDNNNNNDDEEEHNNNDNDNDQEDEQEEEEEEPQPPPRRNNNQPAPATRNNNSNNNSSAPAPSGNEPQAGLAAHNAARARMNANIPNLVWDDQLAEEARQWAEKLPNNGFNHSKSNGKYGENLFMHGNSNFPKNISHFKAAVDDWMTEEDDWPGPGNGIGSAGHFTQVVWKKSRRVGMGMAKRGTSVYVVARYTPAGNFNNEDPF